MRTNTAMANKPEQAEFALVFSAMKNKFPTFLSFLVLAGLGFILGHKYIDHLRNSPNVSNLYNRDSNPEPNPDDRKFFERYLNKRQIPFVLPDVYHIDVVNLENHQDWDTYYSGHQPRLTPELAKGGNTFTLQSNPVLLQMLRNCQSFHTEHLQYKFSSNTVIYCWTEHDADAAPFPYVYIPESGKLRLDHDWCQLPNKFQKAINAAI